MSALFYSFFIFDIIGDALGWRAALPAMLVMLSGPSLAFLCDKVWQQLSLSAYLRDAGFKQPPDQAGSAVVDDEASVELQDAKIPAADAAEEWQEKTEEQHAQVDSSPLPEGKYFGRTQLT